MSDKLTDAEIDALDGKDLSETIWLYLIANNDRGDALLSYHDGWVKGDDDSVWGVPDYSTDASAIREVEAEIDRRGLIQRYIDELLYQHFIIPGTQAYSTFWALIIATPEQRCRAALKAVMQ